MYQQGNIYCTSVEIPFQDTKYLAVLLVCFRFQDDFVKVFGILGIYVFEGDSYAKALTFTELLEVTTAKAEYFIYLGTYNDTPNLKDNEL